MELNFIPNTTFFKVQIKQGGDLIGEFAIQYSRSKIKVIIGKNTDEKKVRIEQQSFGTHDLPRLAKLPVSYSLTHFIVKLYKYGKRYKLFILQRNGGYKGRILIEQNEIVHLIIDKNFEIENVEKVLQEGVRILKEILLEKRSKIQIPKPVNSKGLPKKSPQKYDLKEFRDDKEKWIKWYLSMMKHEYPHYSYSKIIRHILRNDGKIESRTVCHDKLHDEPNFNDEKAWKMCQKVWLLIMTNKATSLKIAKQLDGEKSK